MCLGMRAHVVEYFVAPLIYKQHHNEPAMCTYASLDCADAQGEY